MPWEHTPCRVLVASSCTKAGGALSGIPSVAGAGPQGAPQDIEIPEIQQNAGREQTVRIEIVGGDDFEVARVLIRKISASLEEEDGMLIPTGSRNALELMDP